MQKVAVVGFGFMGGMHAQIYHALPNAELVGVVDTNHQKAVDGLAKLGIQAPVFASIAELLQKVKVDVIDVCLPTDLHKQAALEAIAAGKALFCEKPLALTSKEAQEVVAAAEKAGTLMQVGQAIRFWPEYQALEKIYRSGELGKLVSLTLQRRASTPSYTEGNWILDPKRSNGATLDLHIHDTDFVLHLIGKPKAVTSTGSHTARGWDHINTIYHFDGVSVQAEGGWDYPADWGFQMAFQALFEKGAIEFDSTKNPGLVITRAGSKTEPLPFQAPSIGSSKSGTGNVSSLGGYWNELEYFVDRLEKKQAPEIATGKQALESVVTVEAEIQSAATGKTVSL